MKPMQILKTLVPLSILLIAPCAFAVGAAGNAPPSVTSQTATTIAPVDVTYTFVGDYTPGFNVNRQGCGNWSGSYGQYLPGDGCTGLDSGAYVSMNSPTGDFVVPATGTYYASMEIKSENCNGGSGEWQQTNFWVRALNSAQTTYTDYNPSCLIEVQMWGGGGCFGGGQYYDNNTFGNGKGSTGGTLCSLGVLQKGQHIKVVGQTQDSGTCGPCVLVTGGDIRITSTS